MKQEQVQKSRTKRSSRTAHRDHNTPATDRREIRKDIAKVWWPES